MVELVKVLELGKLVLAEVVAAALLVHLVLAQIILEVEIRRQFRHHKVITVVKAQAI